MIIDDNTVLRRVVAIACSATARLDLVGEARDGEEGLAVCERLAPDLVVLDLALRAIDGLEVARRLRASRNPPR
ncbi:MAG TPA: response regulator, partial [Actinomycetota bacterium]